VSQFPVHSIESAPAGSKPILTGAKSAFGFVPNLLGMLAESPAALEAYRGVDAAFQKTSLTPIEQQVVLLAVSVRNKCRYCVAAHTVIAGGARVPAEVVEALRNERPIADPKLEALRRFTETVIRTRGWANDDLSGFLGAGYTRAQVLEVLVGVTQKTLSNYANHLAETPLDDAFAKAAWEMVAA
jgi:AhpD family alkylhydroperoxidase